MDNFSLFNLAALFFWCLAGVQAAVWLRVVAVDDRNTHVSHFIGLMGVFVPVSCMALGAVLLTAMLQVSLPLQTLFLLLPAGYALGFHLEIANIAGRSDRRDILLLALASCGVAAIAIGQTLG